MTPSTENRPRQVAWAGWLVVIGAAFSVATAFQVVAGARSLETREAISDFLSESPGDGLGIDVESTIQLLQASASVAAVVGAMMTVLGIYALRGDRRARLGLSLLALPLFVSGLALGGFLTSLAAAATGLLWISPAREWYAGLPLPPPPGSPRADRAASSRLSPWSTPPNASPSASAAPSDRTETTQPISPTEGGLADPGQVADPGQHPDAGAQHNPYAPARPARTGAGRPDAVTAAVAVTLVCSGLVLVLTLLGLAVASFATDTLLEEVLRADPTLAEQGVDRTTLLVVVWISGVLTIGAALLAIGLAVMTLTRRRWAATALVVVSWVTVVASVLATISSVVAIVPAIAALVVISCLRRSRTWFVS